MVSTQQTDLYIFIARSYEHSISSITETASFRRESILLRTAKHIYENYLLLIVLISAILLIILGATLGSVLMEWSVADSFYFVVSTMTGVGATSISIYDQPRINVLTVSLYCAVTVLIGNILFVLSSRVARLAGTLSCTTKPIWMTSQGKLDVPFLYPSRGYGAGSIHADELSLLESAGIRRLSKSPHITRHDFFVLTMLRLGKASYEEVRSIYSAFDDLDYTSNGKALFRDIGATKSSQSQPVMHSV